jgi:hypothetical protein
MGLLLCFPHRYVHRFLGSWQETGKVYVLRGFLKSDEFGSCSGQALRFQQ